MTVWHSYELDEEAFIKYFLEYYTEASKDSIVDAIEYDLTEYHPVFIHESRGDNEWLFDELELKRLIMVLKERLKEKEVIEIRR